ncbi:MAG: dihydrodipicolinate synthase family protein [Acidimicrobiales bacterium]
MADFHASTRTPSTFVISITPFDSSERVDEESLRGHLRKLAAARIGVYLAGSGSGEGYTLNSAEVARILQIGKEELAGKVPFRAMGVEPRTAGEMIRLARLVEEIGVEAMQIYSLDQGHGNRPRDDEMERYYSDILEATTVPCVLSTHQSVGYFIPPPLIGRLIDRYDHVIGVNVSGPDMSYLQQVIDAAAGRADVHVGGPMHALTCLALGGQGYLSSEGNLAPNLAVSVIDRFAAGDLAGCFEAYNRLMHLFTATRDMGGITGTKAALQLLGLPGGTMRRPRLALPESMWQTVRQTMIDDVDLRTIEGL